MVNSQSPFIWKRIVYNLLTAYLLLIVIPNLRLFAQITAPAPFHQTTGLLTDLLNHNVSGSINYNNTNYTPGWFTGQTQQHSLSFTPIDPTLEDDSQNAAAGGTEPMNISKSPLGGSTADYLPMGSTTRKMIFMCGYNGLQSHPSNGTDFYGADGGPTIVDMYQRGYDVCCQNWYWPNNPNQPGDAALNVLMTHLPNTNMKFCVGIDQQMLTANNVPVANWQQCIIDQLNHLDQNYFQSPLYEKIGGRPIVLFWDISAAIANNGATVDWSVIRASVTGNPIFIFYQNGGFTEPQSDGSFFWIDPDASDYATGGLGYVSWSLASCAANSGKIRIPSVYCGFNGTKASWRSPLNSWINRQGGLTYIKTWGAVNSWLNAGNGHGAEYVLDVTWDDHKEGSGKFGGQRTDVRLHSTFNYDIVSFTVTGPQATVYAYNLWGTSDNVNITLLGTIDTAVVKKFDLTTIVAPPDGIYTLYVQALSWPGLQNHVAPETFQVGFPLNSTVINKFNSSGIEIYPNPANDKLVIKLTDNKPVIVQLISTEGRIVLDKQTNTQLETFNISSLPKGIYSVKIKQNNNNVFTKKILIK